MCIFTLLPCVVSSLVLLQLKELHLPAELHQSVECVIRETKLPLQALEVCAWS